MQVKSLKKNFLEFCEVNKLEKNLQQLKIIELLSDFINPKKKYSNFFFGKKDKLGFYLFGDVGVGKTMILNLTYNFLDIPKQRYHFNEFMINFHDYRHANKSNSILSFVRKLKKKTKLIYLDEFQVTNIVDAMILGKLFETIFNENIKVLITSNTKIDDLYKEGLQREQFHPFISIIKKNSIQKKLIINEDYRKLSPNNLQRAFYPINEKTTFKLNYLFRELTKNKKLEKIKIDIKGREFLINNFYDGIAKLEFNQLCNTNIGAEDYIKIADTCSFIVIQNIPCFNDENANQQQRFITLIDILYEKKISIMISMATRLENIGSSKKLFSPFKRTLSRIFELTAPK
jgi:cell division protein ZapE